MVGSINFKKKNKQANILFVQSFGIKTLVMEFRRMLRKELLVIKKIITSADIDVNSFKNISSLQKVFSIRNTRYQLNKISYIRFSYMNKVVTKKCP